MTNENGKIIPFAWCPALDGYHCQTNSLAKIFHYHGHPLSEDMLLGLSAGMGFIYWQMQIGGEKAVFIGGRANNKDFFSDVGKRTGVLINVMSTSSAKKAESRLIERLAQKQPVILFGDMGLIPITAKGSKELRALNCVPVWQSGNVYLPTPDDGRYGWVSDYVQELIAFPSAEHDDQVDATTQALNLMRGTLFPESKQCVIPAVEARPLPDRYYRIAWIPARQNNKSTLLVSTRP
jgi:predicted phage terminase large subunit-like protein